MLGRSDVLARPPRYAYQRFLLGDHGRGCRNEPASHPRGSRRMIDWDACSASRATRMMASEMRELLKVIDRPGIISFAGGIPDPQLFPREEIITAYNSIL